MTDNHEEKENWDQHFDKVILTTKEKIKPTHYLGFDEKVKIYRLKKLPKEGGD